MSGRKLVREIPITPIQLMQWQYGASLPGHLSDDQREFIAAGDPARDLS